MSSRTLRGVAKRNRQTRMTERAISAGDAVETWARRRFGRLGEAAVQAAIECRRDGWRDLVLPVELVAKTVPTLGPRVDGGAKCTHGTTRVVAPRTSYKTNVCGDAASVLVITDSGLVSFFCPVHAEKAIVRMPR